MWFLWVFGNNIEDSMGHLRFVGFYLLCGLLAGLAQMIVETSSPVPLVGASGAISGYWAFIQFLGSVPSLAGSGGSGGVAFMAHLGGFISGVALIKLFAKPELLAAHRRPVMTIPTRQRRWGF
jgi:membrane associated rhomboid family serine protease